MNLWLDDLRDPAQWGAIGFVWVKTVAEAQALLESGTVKRASLDHDLGACETCLDGQTEEEWFVRAGKGQAMPNCEHVGTGYDLCLWMAETGHWPALPPLVHSANPEGANRMRGVIARYFGTKQGEAAPGRSE